MQYVLKHSIKNAIAFSRGAEHDEYVRVYEGMMELIKKAIMSKEVLKLAEEKRIQDALNQKKQAEISKAKRKSLYKTLALIFFLLFFVGTAFYNSFTGVPFILFIVFIILGSKK